MEYTFDKTTGKLENTVTIQVVHHGRTPELANTTGNITVQPDWTGPVEYIEYVTVQLDKDGNITEPLYAENEWYPDDYGINSTEFPDYVINSIVLEDGKDFCTKYDTNLDKWCVQDLRPYVHDGVVDVYLNWFRYVG